jgi:tetratricopeptide (TPR) repeat protein
MKTLVASVVLLLIAHIIGLSQCKDISSTVSSTVIEKKALFEDAHAGKHFHEAAAQLHWLLSNQPNLSTSLYIKGAETLDALARAEKNPAKKKVYVDSLMLIYDLRIKNCGEEANVLNRKAISFYNYHYNDNKASEILPLMDKAIDLAGDKILDGLAESYMQVVRISAELKLLDQNQIMLRYDKISNIVNSKIKKAQEAKKPIDRYSKINEENLNILSTLVPINCDFVRKNFGPKFKQNPTDIGLAKKIFTFMLKDKCTEDELWLQAAEAIHQSEKDFGLSKILAMRYLTSQDFDKADKLLSEARELAKSSSDKADILGLQAYLEEKRNGNKAKVRDYYRQALAIDPTKKEFYERIGDLYSNSFEECAKKQHQAADRLVFLAAYDMYQKAGESGKMATAKSLFPSVEEIFELDYKKGDKIKVDCWINEETIIRTRN